MGNDHVHGHHSMNDMLHSSTGGENGQLAKSDALWRLLRPVHLHLAWCAILSAIGAAAGFAPYIAVAEIARMMLGAGRLAEAPYGCGSRSVRLEQGSACCSFSLRRGLGIMRTRRCCMT